MIGGFGVGGQSFYAYRYGVVVIISVKHHNRVNQLHQNCSAKSVVDAREESLHRSFSSSSRRWSDQVLTCISSQA